MTLELRQEDFGEVININMRCIEISARTVPDSVVGD